MSRNNLVPPKANFGGYLTFGTSDFDILFMHLQMLEVNRQTPA